MKRARTALRGCTTKKAAAAVGVAVLMLAGACSSIQAPTDTTAAAAPAASAAPTTAPAVATTAPASATTAAPAVATTAATTTTTEPPPPFTAQFTGIGSYVEIVRPAAVVKIDNHPRALPQWGINQADVVYEELVEAGLTRLAAIFHSQDAEIVGPVRSARTGDFGILSNLNRPLFVNSGANDYTQRALRDVDAANITHGGSLDRDVFERSSEKNAPHNLITSTARIYASGAEHGRTPPPYMGFREPGEALGAGTAVSGVDVDFGQIEVTYRWDAALSGWVRTQNGEAHTDFGGTPVAPENVVVQFVRYRQSPANRATPEPVLTGGGDAWIFSDGKVVQGTWERLSEQDTTVFRTPNALILGLTPGRTWIALARAETAVLVP